MSQNANLVPWMVQCPGFDHMERMSVKENETGRHTTRSGVSIHWTGKLTGTVVWTMDWIMESSKNV